MEIIEVLSLLGFSFWQMTIIIVVLMFKKEAKALFARISKVKAGNAELAFDKSSAEIDKLQALKEIVDNGKTTKENIKVEIDSMIRNKAFDAVFNLRVHTLRLWDELLRIETKSVIKADMMRHTVRKVESDLHLLQRANYFNYIIRPSYESKNGDGIVYEVTINNISPELIEMVEEVRGLNVSNMDR